MASAKIGIRGVRNTAEKINNVSNAKLDTMLKNPNTRGRDLHKIRMEVARREKQNAK